MLKWLPVLEEKGVKFDASSPAVTMPAVNVVSDDFLKRFDEAQIIRVRTKMILELSICYPPFDLY